MRFPDEVAALLLLDPAHEDYNAYMPEELTKMWEGWSKKQLGIPLASPKVCVLRTNRKQPRTGRRPITRF